MIRYILETSPLAKAYYVLLNTGKIRTVMQRELIAQSICSIYTMDFLVCVIFSGMNYGENQCVFDRGEYEGYFCTCE